MKASPSVAKVVPRSPAGTPKQSKQPDSVIVAHVKASMSRMFESKSQQKRKRGEDEHTRAAADEVVGVQTEKKKSGCKLCGELGHYAKTCKKRKTASGAEASKKLKIKHVSELSEVSELPQQEHVPAGKKKMLVGGKSKQPKQPRQSRQSRQSREAAQGGLEEVHDLIDEMGGECMRGLPGTAWDCMELPRTAWNCLELPGTNVLTLLSAYLQMC